MTYQQNMSDFLKSFFRVNVSRENFSRENLSRQNFSREIFPGKTFPEDRGRSSPISFARDGALGGHGYPGTPCGLD